MAKKEVEEDPPVDDSWLASYADAMTLLMAFFIMMFAFALVDESKFEDFKVGVVMAIGIADPVTDNTASILGAGQGIAPEIGLGAVPSSQVEALMRSVQDALREDGTVTPENAEEVKELLEAKYELAGLKEFVDVEITPRGIVIRFEGRLLFDSGAYSLTGDADVVLSETSQVMTNFDNFVDVEGHTDDLPTGSLIDTNWNLSSNRASAVVNWLITRGGVETIRLRAIGLAATVPRDTNETPEGRQENRRVELVILVDGLVGSDIDLINAIPDDVVGGVKDNPLVDDPGIDDVVVGEGSAGTEGTPVEIDPIGDPLGFPAGASSVADE